MRSVVVAVLVVGALVTGATPAIGAAAQAGVESGERAIDGASRDALAQQSTPVQNNSTIRHRNPEEVRAETRLGDLQRVLGSRLADKLEESSIRISQEQYEAARSALGDEYLEQLDKYGAVADERDDENATAAAETFNETRERQREFAESVETFRETYQAYREARANGNDREARRQARELVELAQRASRQAEQLNAGYARLEERTNENLTEARRSVTEVETELSTDASAVQTAEFTPTTLVIRDADETGSYADPIRVRATLRTADGPIGDRQIRLAIGQQRYTVETDADGRVTLSYRPTVVPVNTSVVTVRYVPVPTSTYGSSNTSFPVTLEGTTGTVALDETTTEAGFGDRVGVTGRFTVAGDGVAGVPLAIAVEGVRLGTVETAADGSFAFEGSMPAVPAAGSRTLRVENGTEGLALSADPAATPFRVRETRTTLTAGAIDAGETVRLVGQLRAADRPVPDQRIRASVAGDRIGTARTSADGAFGLSVDENEINGSVRLAFDGDGTNLGGSETTLTIRDPADTEAATPTPTGATDARSGSGLGQLLALFGLFGTGLAGGGVSASRVLDALGAFLTTPLGLVSGGVVLGVGGLVLVVLLRWREGAIAARDSEVSAGAVAGEDETNAGSTVSIGADQFAAVESELAAGQTDDAVLGAYGLVRQALGARVPTERARSHWQFFEACTAAGADSEALRTLTETYERARYGAESVSRSLAERAVASARQLTDAATDGDASEGSTEPGD